MSRARWIGCVGGLLVCGATGCLEAQGGLAAALAGGRVVPDDVWVADDFGDPGHFLLAGAATWEETAVVWFDVQLLPSSDAYAMTAAVLEAHPRSELRSSVVARLKAISADSWARAHPAIDSLIGAGDVTSCVPMWIVNGASCSLRPDADPRPLTRVPGVVRVFRGMPRRDFPRPETRGPPTVEVGAAPPFDAAKVTVPWNLRMLHVPELWAEGFTGRGVRIAIHDGGFQLDTEPVRHTLWTNPGEVAGNGVDDDGNGYVDDVHGFQFDEGSPAVNRAAVVRNELIHGTAVAALAAGRHTTDSNVQLGVAPDAQWAALMAVRNFHEALQWAIEQEFDVYGMSFSYPGLGPLRSHFRKMLEHAALAGLFLVSGAGNFGDPSSTAFAAVPVQLRTPEDVPLAVFGVAGVDSTGARPSFSSRGPVEWATLDYVDGTVAKPDLATSNTDLIVPRLDGRAATGVFRGNSFAAPQLAGVLALLIQADPEVTPWTLREILVRTARDIGDAGADMETGAGLVDAAAALRSLRERRTVSR